MQGALWALAAALSLGLALPWPSQASSAPPIDAFAELPPVASASLSPDGTRLAMLQPMDGRYRPVVVTLDDAGTPVESIHLEPSADIVDVMSVSWSGTERLLISALGRRPYQRLPDSRVLVYSLARRRLDPLIRPPPAGGHTLRAQRQSKLRQLSIQLIDPLRYTPEQAIAVVTGPQADGSEVWRIHLDRRSGTALVDDASDYLTFQTGPKGRLRLITRAPDGREEVLYRADADAAWQILTPPIDPDAGEHIVGIDSDASALWLLRPAGDRGRVLHRFDPATGDVSAALFGPTKRDVERILVETGPERQRLIGYVAAGHQPREVYLDPQWAARKRRIDARLPETVNRIVSSNTAATRHVVVARSVERPPRYWLFDEPTGSLHALGGSSARFDGSALPTKRPVRYPARDGTPIPAYLTVPRRGEPPYPAVVLVHGGPHNRADQAYEYWVQFLASRGFAVLQPNFRGSSGYGEAWERAGRWEWGGLMQRDVADGADWLGREGIADPARICIMGGSYGGYAALMGVARTPERYACAIAVNAVSDLERMVRDDRRRYPGAPWTRFVGLGEEGHQREEGEEGDPGEGRLARASPLRYAERITAPVLLIHAADDLRVPVHHSREMAKALEKSGTDARFVRLDAGGHPLNRTAARREVLAASERFLTAVLSRRSPDPPRPP